MVYGQCFSAIVRFMAGGATRRTRERMLENPADSALPTPLSVEVAPEYRLSVRQYETDLGTMRGCSFGIQIMASEQSCAVDRRVPIAVSARHAHLSEATVQKLFGEGYKLRVRNWLSQTGQFSAEETVTLVGPRGRLENVRLMGPPREYDQLELSRTDECTLGITAPLRLSGDLESTPGLQIVGPAGSVTLHSGVIKAQRHIHMNPKDAQRLGLHDGQVVSVKIDSSGRDLIFGDVIVRVAPDFRLELHLDTDEANAGGVANGDYGEIL